MNIGSLNQVLHEFTLEDLGKLDDAVKDGVGQHAGAMAAYKYKYLDEAVHDAVKYAEDTSNKPLLKMMHKFDDSIEEEIEAAGLVSGPVKGIPLLITIMSAIAMITDDGKSLENKIKFIANGVGLSAEETKRVIYFVAEIMKKSGVQ